MDEWPYRLLAFVGFFTIASLAWATGRRSRLNWKTIGGSVVLAWGWPSSLRSVGFLSRSPVFSPG